MTPLEPEPQGATPFGPDDMEGLKLSYISTRAQLDAAEFDNIASAGEWTQRRAQAGPAEVLTVGFLLELHQQMFGQVWDWAGKWRRRQTNIGVDWTQIPQDVANTLADALYRHEHNLFSGDDIAVRVHHRLAQIHPFPNGNGRLARYIADLYLVSAGIEPFTWGRGTLTAAGDARNRYIGILQTTDTTGDYTEMIEFARS
jgi:Fic-DOC domain mobile mystery protein B